MPKTDNNTVFYDLTLSQNVIHYSLTYSIYKQAMNVAVCLLIKNELDFDLLKKAVRAEIGRNDCLRLYYKKIRGKLKQYFIKPEEAEKLPLNIVTADFSGKTYEEQKAYLLRDAAVPVRFKKDEIYRFIFLKTYDGRNAVYFVTCHMNMDAMSVFMTFRDLLEIYRSLSDNTAMPKPFHSFKDFILREREKLMDKSVLEKNKNFYLELFKNGGEPIYCSPSGFKALENLRKKHRNPNKRSYPSVSPLQDQSKNIKFHLSPSFTNRIDGFCEGESVSPQSLFQFALCAYLSKINNDAGDILYLSNCTGRATVADKNTFGCMVGTVTLRTFIDGKTELREALSRSAAAATQAYRYPYYSGVESAFALQKMYKLSVFDHYVSYLISYLAFPAINDWEYEAEWVSNGHFAMGLYCVIIKNPADGGYDVFYEYRTKLMNADHIVALHNGMAEVIKLSMENPESEIAEIISKVI
ncbi:MAG: condensation domain-containing protein [Eubacteriales bacterium]